MLSRLDRENIPGRSTSDRSAWRPPTFALVLALCIALILCSPVTAANVTAYVCGANSEEAGGFGQASVWTRYLAEGTTYGGMETWVVVFNPNNIKVTFDITFYTDGGQEVAGPQGVELEKHARMSFLLNSLVPDKKDVSTRVISYGGGVICERAVYGPGRAWAHECSDCGYSSGFWYLAEGTTYGGMETWVVVFNPGPGDATFDLTFYTDGGQEVPGPQDFSLPPGHRHSFLLNSLVPNKKDVSTTVSCDTGKVICERAVYGPGRAWAHDSLGVTYSTSNWYLAEGTTYGGMETWVVVFNPGPGDATFDLTFCTDGGEEVPGPQDFSLPPGHRHSFLLNSLVPNKKDVSTIVNANSGDVICERAVYGPGRAWAHECSDCGYSSGFWYLAEGTTYGGMETWVVVFNPYEGEAIFDLTFYTDGGVEVAGPQNFLLPPGHRHSFLLNSLVPNKKDVSTTVSCDTGKVVCERAVYGPGKIWAHASLGRAC